MHRMQYPSKDPFVEFFTGGAGTGKRLTIRCISQLIIRTFNSRLRAYISALKVLLTSFINIDGVAMHSAVRIPIHCDISNYEPLSGEARCAMREELAFVKCLVIDDISSSKWVQFPTICA